jgi:hypothetical protein
VKVFPEVPTGNRERDRDNLVNRRRVVGGDYRGWGLGWWDLEHGNSGDGFTVRGIFEVVVGTERDHEVACARIEARKLEALLVDHCHQPAVDVQVSVALTVNGFDDVGRCEGEPVG